MWTSCELQTSSHSLSQEAFSVFASSQGNTRIQVLSSSELRISVQHIGDASDSTLDKLAAAHHAIQLYLIALNVASLGYFYWKQAPWLHPVFTLSKELGGANATQSALIATPEHTYPAIEPVSKLMVQNAILVFGMLAKERTFALDSEYAKGLLLLRMRFANVHFRTEAFMCFYRALEYFIASRVLGLSKLSNELKDIQRGLELVGLGGILAKEFKEIYVLRSSQAAHTQVTPRDLTFDEVMKAKIFLDFVIHKTFVAQGNAIMQSKADAVAKQAPVAPDAAPPPTVPGRGP